MTKSLLICNCSKVTDEVRNERLRKAKREDREALGGTNCLLLKTREGLAEEQGLHLERLPAMVDCADGCQYLAPICACQRLAPQTPENLLPFPSDFKILPATRRPTTICGQYGPSDIRSGLSGNEEPRLGGQPQGAADP